MILMIDNYDSFTYNIVQYLCELGHEVVVKRNDEIDCEGIRALNPDYLIIGPGPCDPPQAGVSLTAIRTFAGQIPILGVCLGHQAIGEAFGGKTIRAQKLMHGKVSAIRHHNSGVFVDLPNPVVVTRYHSLAVDKASLPECLLVHAESEDGEIMGLRHRTLPIEGVQFHPEALLTEHGHAMFANFLREFANPHA